MVSLCGGRFFQRGSVFLECPSYIHFLLYHEESKLALAMSFRFYDGNDLWTDIFPSIGYSWWNLLISVDCWSRSLSFSRPCFFWKAIRKLDIILKVKNFWWRVLTNIFPTKAKVNTKHFYVGWLPSLWWSWRLISFFLFLPIFFGMLTCLES